MVVITCPACGKNVQLPDEMLGERAVCPYCKSLFKAPARLADGTLTPATLQRTNPFAKSRAFAPGLLLVLFGSLSLIWNGAHALQAQLDPVAFERQTREDFAQMAQFMKQSELKDKDPEDPAVVANAEAKAAEFNQKADVTIRWLPWFRVLFMGLSIVSLLGGLGMVRRRWHSLAMLGSVAAMFNVLNYFCLGGMPIGAWALFVLMNPAVRDQFHGAKPTAKS
ncbi:hypothetical protein [Zavarzinella formosa]|uniref:hypothetical protein n=1 Tax=Zavarzinella formosa TaxID=360055 RepID=UPI00031A0A04|nr:hypothetical protein [Zavarzinella formosa]